MASSQVSVSAGSASVRARQAVALISLATACRRSNSSSALEPGLKKPRLAASSICVCNSLIAARAPPSPFRISASFSRPCAFRDMAGHIHRRSAKLHAQSEGFRLWKFLGLRVDRSRQLHRLLPCNQIPIMPCSRHEPALAQLSPTCQPAKSAQRTRQPQTN